jgi:antitoxin component HigA of HigAB toxin-antitoxin module
VAASGNCDLISSEFFELIGVLILRKATPVCGGCPEPEVPSESVLAALGHGVSTAQSVTMLAYMDETPEQREQRLAKCTEQIQAGSGEIPSGDGAYFSLVTQFPLLPIKDTNSAKAASALVTEMVMTGEGLSNDEADYLAALSTLLSEWESKHLNELTESMDMRALLEYLLEENGMSKSELAEKIGCTSSTISDFLSGNRDLSKTMSLKLADLFSLKSDAFLR